MLDMLAKNVLSLSSCVIIAGIIVWKGLFEPAIAFGCSLGVHKLKQDPEKGGGVGDGG
jgi:hypothetical protein